MRSFLLTLSLLLLPASALAQQPRPDLFFLSVGEADLDEADNAAFIGGEWRAERFRFWRYAVPFLTGFATQDGSAYGGFGIAFPFTFFADSIGFSAFTGFGGYRQGNGKDLGSIAQFRSGGEVSYILPSKAQISLGVDHISNAGIDQRNPGSNQIFLRYAIPFR